MVQTCQGTAEATEASSVQMVKMLYRKFLNLFRNVDIIFDRTWKTRGHNLNIAVGCILELYPSLVLNHVVLSRYCRGCQGAPDPDGNGYGYWVLNKCLKNIDCNAKRMEAKAVPILFERSLVKDKQRLRKADKAYTESEKVKTMAQEAQARHDQGLLPGSCRPRARSRKTLTPNSSTSDPFGGSTVDVAKNGGPMVVSMVGEDVDPDFCAGWMRARARGGTQVEKEPRPSSYVARKVIEKVERMGRMPRVGLEGENKVVVRPRGGLDLRKTSIVVVADAIRAAAGISEEEASLDTQCPNVQQNVVVISTGSDARAVKYAAVTCICVAGRSYEVRAYVTAPFDTVKGVIRGVPVHHTAEEIERLLIGPRNPTVRAAERIGSSATVVVIFGGDVVPHQVFYGGSVLRCSLYRKHYEVCKTCGRVGHRTDVCPTPGVRRCLGCGGTPDPGHACSPRCGLCGGPHVTGDKVCNNRFRTPYIVHRRLWERAERGLSGDRPSPPPRGSAEEYSRLGRSRSRSRESERPAARSRSRSTSDQVTWAQAVQSDRGKVAKIRKDRSVSAQFSAPSPKIKAHPPQQSSQSAANVPAFDRVRHSAILRGVADAGLGRRSYNYVKDFLSGRTARLLAGDLDVGEGELGSVGTPQGSVISPVLFNLVMVGAARGLCEEGIPHSIYADDLTLWCTNRRKEVVQGTLQRGIEIIEEALMGSGLECAPEKSELLVCYAGRCRWDEMRLIAGGGPVPRVDALRVLGLFVQEKAGNSVMLGKIQGKVASALRMIQRVTSRRKGIREAGVMRMVQAFVLSHIMYVTPYLRWRAGEKNKLDAMVRRAYKSALGLYAFTSTKKLEMLGVHNTIGEIVEAHRASQIQRLERTPAGRGVLRRVGMLAEDASDGGGLTGEVMKNVRVRPVPRHMHPVRDKGRREARAQALFRLYGREDSTVYVDAALRGVVGVAVAVKAGSGEVLSAPTKVKVPQADGADHGYDPAGRRTQTLRNAITGTACCKARKQTEP
ncbi:hypothetical protein ISCGN_013898 [Ixodes scapularis]